MGGLIGVTRSKQACRDLSSSKKSCKVKKTIACFATRRKILTAVVNNRGASRATRRRVGAKEEARRG
jgi:hypothetical protein